MQSTEPLKKIIEILFLYLLIKKLFYQYTVFTVEKTKAMVAMNITFAVSTVNVFYFLLIIIQSTCNVSSGPNLVMS